MNQLLIPCRPGEVSDGYHTFDELYMHRAALLLSLMKAKPTMSWYSKLHDDGTMFTGMFIAGVQLPTGGITYHLECNLWDAAVRTGAAELELAPKWDGHTPADVVSRLLQFVNNNDPASTLTTEKEAPEFQVALVGKSVVVRDGENYDCYVVDLREGDLGYTQYMREASVFTYDKELWEKLHKGMTVIEVDPTL
jgi:hypothetical protein